MDFARQAGHESKETMSKKDLFERISTEGERRAVGGDVPRKDEQSMTTKRVSRKVVRRRGQHKAPKLITILG